MKTIRTVLAIISLILPAAASAQRPIQSRAMPNQMQRPPQAAGRRDALEAQVLNRFVNRASQEMALDGNQRTRLIEVVRASSQRRKLLNQRTNELHRRFAEAIRDQATAPDAFAKLLSDHQQLRRDEQQIMDTEQTELQKFLTPRQQAHFLMLWIRLQENARQVQAQLPPGGPGGQ